MQLAMTFGMKELTVGGAGRATQHPGGNVMVVPSGLAGNGIAADNALSLLDSPEIKQRFTAP